MLAENVLKLECQKQCLPLRRFNLTMKVFDAFVLLEHNSEWGSVNKLCMIVTSPGSWECPCDVVTLIHGSVLSRHVAWNILLSHFLSLFIDYQFWDWMIHFPAKNFTIIIKKIQRKIVHWVPVFSCQIFLIWPLCTLLKHKVKFDKIIFRLFIFLLN